MFIYEPYLYHMMNRRQFFKGVSAAVVITACGKIARAITPADLDMKTTFRFAVGSDWHYGEPNTPSDQYFTDLKNAFTKFNAENPCEFFVLNGDIFHNNPDLLLPAAEKVKTIHPAVYVTRGNHDRVTPEAWQQAWGHPLNHDVVMGDKVILLGDTATIEGKYVSPDVDWFSRKLEQYKDAKHIFIFVHITPVKWTANGVDAQEFQQLVRKYPNIKGVFSGHDHDQDGVKQLDGCKVPFLFDGHVGGSWGVNYHGFRVVELKKDGSLFSYIMNPVQKQGEKVFK
ncbi:Calcineurin-like phosphoesterase [Chitinophaga terrae (ex Kim and Jung 2007)]|uniref:Calcineurin-like phosphoesterase n=2 Tax=Chitinophaga terrae (ex Kim and Jung 2007) TaxID=408074 RepID=A0A1H4DRE3_9BACT|nr:Calcineurin-like phosphoesterase [Chitinophaga terrae (ex Kim and Jung 2007)]